jgi:hypothetical protein
MQCLIRAVVLVAGVSAAGCADDTRRAAEAQAAEFQRSADANDAAALKRLYPTKSQGWEKHYLVPRASLGRTQRTSLEFAEDVTYKSHRVIHLNYNTEFERGHAYERFSFGIDVDKGAMELTFYGFYPGQVFECFPIGGCDISDRPTKDASR